jgi:SAM-dependent methyltransferase
MTETPQRGINRKPLRILPKFFLDLYFFILRSSYSNYQPVASNRGQSHFFERDALNRWIPIRAELSKHRPQNILDIGCAEGYYLAQCSREFGSYCLGLEGDYSRYCIAQTQFQTNATKRCAVIFDEINTDSINKLCKFDAVIFLSVLHHVMYSYGQNYALEFMSKLRTKVNKVLIFEMGQSNETTAKWAGKLPDMGSDPQKWIAEFLKEAGFNDIRKIGESKSYFGDCNRTIFAASP